MKSSVERVVGALAAAGITTVQSPADIGATLAKRLKG